MHHFDERYIFYGTLSNSTTKVEDVRCEAILNEISTDSMKATISHFTGDTQQAVSFMSSKEVIRFEAMSGEEKVYLEGDIPSISFGGYNDEAIKFFIRKCVFEKRKDELHISKLYFTVKTPNLSIYQRHNVIYKHYQKGLLSGWDDFDKSNKDGKWKDEKYVIESVMGDIAIYPAFLFKEIEIDQNEMTLVADQMLFKFEFEGDDLNPIKIEQQFLQLLDAHLLILSFLENTRVDWLYCSIYGKSQNEKKFYEKKIYKWYPHLNNLKGDSSHYKRYRNSYQQMHVNLVNAYFALSMDLQEQVKNAIEKLLIASNAEIIDFQLVQWHSCLDVLWKINDGKGKSFSHKLISACKQKSIDWLDLYPDLTEDAINSGEDFPINKIRNEMLHYGKHPEDYELAFDAIRKSRALCERFIVKLLNSEYKNTGIGINRV